MVNHRTSFRHVDGRVFLVVEQLVWGEWLILFEKDVTNQAIPVINDCLNYQSKNQ